MGSCSSRVLCKFSFAQHECAFLCFEESVSQPSPYPFHSVQLPLGQEIHRWIPHTFLCDGVLQCSSERGSGSHRVLLLLQIVYMNVRVLNFVFNVADFYCGGNTSCDSLGFDNVHFGKSVQMFGVKHWRLSPCPISFNPARENNMKLKNRCLISRMCGVTTGRTTVWIC
jgi:hypothetical protein